MKILVIAYHFPPDPAVGALRPGRLVQMLSMRGHDVHVLAGPLEGEPPLRVNATVTVERPEPWLDPRATWARLRNRRNGNAGASAKGGNAVWASPQRTATWKRHILALLWLPDDRQGWMAAAIRRGRALLRSGIDLVYTSAPPFSTHLVGRALRRKTKQGRWIAEFRDPWTDNPWKPDFVRTRWSDSIDRALERSCLQHADVIVPVTEAVADRFRGRLGNGAGKVVVVRNGIEPSAVYEPPPPGNGTLLYVGNLYHGRDPRPFLDALAELHGGGSLPPDAAVDFVGACSHFQGVDVQAYANGLGLQSIVSVREPVPHDVCMRMVRAASGLLLLAQDQPLQVPNKLYEYLGAGRPILALADPDGETARMLKRAGGHQVVVDGDPARIRRAIQAVFDTGGVPTGVDEAIIREWGVESQFARLVELIEGGPQHGLG